MHGATDANRRVVTSGIHVLMRVTPDVESRQAVTTRRWSTPVGAPPNHTEAAAAPDTGRHPTAIEEGFPPRLYTVGHLSAEVAAIVRSDGRLAVVGELELRLPIALLDLLEDGLTGDLRTELAEASEKLRVDQALAPDDVHIGPLYRRLRKIWLFGLNYRDHAKDLAADYPDEPASFIKGDHTIIGPGDDIVLSPQSKRVTAEAELGLVIGQHCQDVEAHDALSYVAGVVNVLDQTVEEILARNPRYLTRSKRLHRLLVRAATGDDG